MIAFRSIAGDGSLSVGRPLLDVYLGPEAIIPQTCLVDTGAAGVRLSAALAEAAGVALAGEPTHEDLIIGGVRSRRRDTELRLTVDLPTGPVAWSAVVSLCDPWPHPVGLLGLHGFLDRFDLRVQARFQRFTLGPSADLAPGS